MPFPPPATKLVIFDAMPAATSSTFSSGVPGTNTQQQNLAIILFSPNLQIIASLDNTRSKVTSSYTVDVTTGFTFSSTQSVSITDEVGVNVEVVTASTSVTFALSITEEWTKSTTKSMSFSCPPGEQAFIYQGTLMSRVLAFSASDATYSWQGDTSKALTQVLVATDAPIGSVPSNAVTVNSQ